MSYEVIIQPSAERDIDEICDYCEKHFLPPQTSTNFIDNLKKLLQETSKLSRNRH
jgi:plasmid stabilization system protein ParE